MHKKWDAVVGQLMAPQDVHILDSGTCDCVTLRGKRDFVGVT